jgi:hypothetical protein
VPWPNFLIIGAQKSGTSSLYRYGSAHPQIFMSKIKEPKFFAMEGDGFDLGGPFLLPSSVSSVADEQEYKALFNSANGELAIGEASTWYLHCESAPQKIVSIVPEVKLVAILRDPVKRAYSNYLHARDYLNIEPLDTFRAAVEAERDRIDKGWGHPWYYLQKGFYYRHLKRYLDHFSRSQIRVYLTTDLASNARDVISDFYSFLEVEASFLPDFSKRYNVSPSMTRSVRLHSFLDKPNRLKRVVKPLVPKHLRRWLKFQIHLRNRKRMPISPELRYELIRVFRKDILQLQHLIERDLTPWLTVN